MVEDKGLEVDLRSAIEARGRHRSLRVAVNLSRPEVLRHDLAEQVRETVVPLGEPSVLRGVERCGTPSSS